MIILPIRAQIATQGAFSESLIQSLDVFYSIASAASWQDSVSLKRTLPTATILTNDRVIVEIENKYYLLLKIHYPLQAIKVEFFVPYGNLSHLLTK